MNYLAHLYFAGTDDESIVGNYLGDFVKGRVENLNYEQTILQGIKQHRSIDRIADEYISGLLHNNKLKFNERRYAGITFDMACDHFLAKHWQDFHSFSQKHFANTRIDTLKKFDPYMNQGARFMLERMEQYRWLENYQDTEFLRKVFQGIQNRFPRQNSIAQAYYDIENNYEELEIFCLELLNSLQTRYLSTKDNY